MKTDPTTLASKVGGTFLDGLEPGLRDSLLVGSSVWTAAEGELIIAPSTAWTRAVMLRGGLARAFLAASDGRQLTVRYARSGELIGNVVSMPVERAPLGIAAVTACELLEFDVEVFEGLATTNAGVAGLLVDALSRRLEDTYATLAANTFGSMRERLAGHLLDLGEPHPGPRTLVVNVTQQQLADSVGTVREVIARTLREFREEGLVSTTQGSIVLLDTPRLASLVGRWRARASG